MVIDSLVSTLSANPLLAGGVGTVAFGSLMYVLRSVPGKIVSFVERTFWTKLFVESLSNEFLDIDGFVERNRLSFFSRSLEVKDGALKTGFGGGWGLYGGTLFHYTKAKSTQQIAPIESIAISFFTRDRRVIEAFIRDSRPDEHKHTINVSLINGNGGSAGLRRRKRGLDTVFVDQEVKDRLAARLCWFLGAEEWHAARGIPWKLGVVLHGPPGTGKTSLIHALASDFGFDIKYVKSLHGLGEAFRTGTRNDLFVIEDIDTLSGSLDRGALAARGQSGEPMLTLTRSPLHDILNSMDGMQTPDGLKFIVTTNHIGRLDPAIVRPGRIDDVIEIGPLSLASARQMFRAFYGRDGIDASYTPRTGAELQQLFSTLSAEAAETELSRPLAVSARA